MSPLELVELACAAMTVDKWNYPDGRENLAGFFFVDAGWDPPANAVCVPPTWEKQLPSPLIALTPNERVLDEPHSIGCFFGSVPPDSGLQRTRGSPLQPPVVWWLAGPQGMQVLPLASLSGGFLIIVDPSFLMAQGVISFAPLLFPTSLSPQFLSPIH